MRLKHLFLTALALPFAVSCLNPIASPSETSARIKRCTVEAERAGLEWSDGDRIGLYNDYDDFCVSIVCRSGVKMTADLPQDTKMLYAVSPFTADSGEGPKSVTLSINPSQTQKEAGVLNGSSIPMVATGAVDGNIARLQFRPAASAFAVSAYKSAGNDGTEKLRRVRVTPLNATGYDGDTTGVDLTSKAAILFTKGGKSIPVTVSLDSLYVLGTEVPGAGAAVFACLARQNYHHVKFEVETSCGLYTIEKEEDYDLTSDSPCPVVLDLCSGTFNIGGVLPVHEGYVLEETEDTGTGSLADLGEIGEWENLDHDVIPDFSRVGYKRGDAPIPSYSRLNRVGDPTGGDDTQNIQTIIDQASGQTVIQLRAGQYKVEGTIFIDKSDIILRGDPAGTSIIATGKDRRPLIYVGQTQKDGATRLVKKTSENIVSVLTSSPFYSNAVKIAEEYVPVGRMYVDLEETGHFSAGDKVAIYRPATENWLTDIRSNRIGENPGQTLLQWNIHDYNIWWERTVVAVKGNRIFFDNPVVMALDAKYGGGYVMNCSWDRVSGVGVEDLTLLSEFDKSVTDGYGYADEEHAWVAVQFQSAENCWARNITSKYFGLSLADMTVGSKLITVENCQCQEPVSLTTGSRRYAFHFSGNTQLCLVRNCTCEKDRHQFVTAARVPGPNVFLDCTSTTSYAEAGPHQRWATGCLYDNVNVAGDLAVQDAEFSGTGQSWEGAYFVFWNCTAGGRLVCQSPWASAKNYAVGCIGLKKATLRNYHTFGPRPDGEWWPERALDSTGGEKVMLPCTTCPKSWWPLFSISTFTRPESLYQSQLEDRHARGIYLENL